MKIRVGTAASTMPRLPPSARESWARTTCSTVSARTGPEPEGVLVVNGYFSS